MATLATLLVKLGLDSSDVDSGLQGLMGRATGFRGFMQRSLEITTGLATAVPVLGAIESGFGAIKDSVFGTNASLESTTLQFGTLMGDADKAKSHVASLFEFGAKTPFETEPILAASRSLQVFGGASLNTLDNLTLFGNAAAATSAPLEQVGFWTGRLYNALQAGKPFGDAAASLTEMGIASPAVLAEMEKLQKAGASADDIWKLWTTDMGRFDGAMEKQAGTLSGMMSTISDTVQMTAATAFQPFFQLVKDGASFLTSPETQAGIAAFADIFATQVAAGIQAVTDLLPTIISGVQSLWNVVQLLITGDFNGGIFGFSEDHPFVLGLLAARDAALTAVDWVNQFADAVSSNVTPVIDAVVPVVERFVGVLMNDGLGAAVSDLVGQMREWGPVGSDMADILGNLGTLITDTIIPGAQSLIATVVDIVSNFTGWNSATTASQSIFGGLGDTLTGLIAIIADVTNFIRDNQAAQAVLVGVVAALTTAWALNTAATIAATTAKVAGTAATGLMTAAQTALNTVMAMNPIGLVVIALAALAAGLIYAYNHSETFRNAVDAAWAAVKKFASDVVTQIGILRADWERDWNSMMSVLRPIGDYIGGVFTAAVRGIASAFDWVMGKINAFKSTLNGIKNALPDWLTPGSPTPMEWGVRGVAEALSGLVTNELPRFRNMLESLGRMDGVKDTVGILKDLFSTIEEGVKALTAVQGYKTSDEYVHTIFKFVDDMGEAIEQVAFLTDEFELKWVEAAAKFSGAAKEVFSLISDGFEALNGLNEYKGMSSLTLQTLIGDMAVAITQFQEMAEGFSVDGVTAAAEMSKGMGEIVKTIAGAFQAFTDITEYTDIPAMVFQTLLGDMSQATIQFTEAVEEFNVETVGQAAVLSKAITDIVGLIGTAFEVFSQIEDYQGMAPGQMQLLQGDIAVATNLMIEIAANANVEGVQAAAEFAKALQEVFDLFKTGVEALDAVRDYQAVPSDRLQAVAADFYQAMYFMEEIVRGAKMDAVQMSAEFAEHMMTVFESFKAGTEAMDALRDYEEVPAERIAAFFRNFQEVEGRLGHLVLAGKIAKKYAEEWRDLMLDVRDAIKMGVEAYNEIMNVSTDQLAANAEAAADRAVDAAKSTLDIHSPSRRMAEEVGIPMIEGIAMGFADAYPAFADAYREMLDMLVGQAEDVADQIREALKDAFDFKSSLPRQMLAFEGMMHDFRRTAGQATSLEARQQMFQVIDQLEQRFRDAQQVASQMSLVDPVKAKQYLELQTRQLNELGSLYAQLYNPSNDEYTQAELMRMIELTRVAQQAELQAWLAQNSANLPATGAGGAMPPPPPGGSGYGFTSAPGAGVSQPAGGTTNNYNLTVNTQAKYEDIIADFQMMEAWGLGN